MKGLLVFAFALLVTAAFSCAVRGHSWYPKECCSGQDCMLADGIYTDTGGNRIVKVGHRRVWVPPGFPVRPSPDARIHICFTDDVYGHQMPRCVFMPAES